MTDFVADTEGERDVKKIALFGGLAAVVLGAGGYLLLSGGEEETEGFPVVKRPVVAAPAAAKPTKAKPVAKPQIPATSTVKLGRDPFLALYTVPVAAAPAAGAPATGGDGAGSGTDSPATPTVTSSPYSLTLLAVTGAANEDKVFTFNVGGTKKTVVAAQKFGKYAELVTLNYIKNDKGTPVAALVQVGDDDPVVIRIGEKLTVL